MSKAGWIFNLDSEESLKRYIRDGVYATKIKPPTRKSWGPAYLGTLADYASMQAGEQIYFFIKRKIYGVGELVNIEGTDTCVFDNFENASLPQNYHDEFFGKTEGFYSQSLLYYEENVWKEKIKENKDNVRYFQQRWGCCFKPTPHFYEGIDTDDMLKSDRTFRGLRSLRTFEGLTFIKLPPDENAAFLDYIKTHETPRLPDASETSYVAAHKKLSEKYKAHNQLGLGNLLTHHQASKKKKIQSEMLLEAYMLFHLIRRNQKLEKIFGKWDYLSHQVTASPFKPIQYMTKIDICGYTGGTGFGDAKKYVIMELKKDIATQDDFKQVQKYIEWFKWEYGASEDRIESFLVAHKFQCDDVPSNIKLVKYIATGDEVSFELVPK
ncbi:MAG: hypothetical protein EBR02_02275 [Alphaproteobacteria bacterium]|nr:hypothetical protein [Alphaproteobacteria bacterium]